MVQVYKEPLCKRHHAPALSAAWLFRVAGFILSALLAVVIAWGTGELWKTTRIGYEQPTVSFSSRMLAVFEGAAPDGLRVWSSSDTVNEALGSRVPVAKHQMTELDHNHDGKPDLLYTALTVHDVPSFSRVSVLVEFDYLLEDSMDLNMSTIGYFSLSSPLPSARLDVYTTLELSQKELFSDDSSHTIYNTSLLFDLRNYFSASDVSKLSLNAILQEYNFRNVTTVCADIMPVWQQGSGEEFTVAAHIQIPYNQRVVYRMPRLASFKGGAIQILAVWILLWYLWSWLEWILFHHQVLETRVFADGVKSV